MSNTNKNIAKRYKLPRSSIFDPQSCLLIFFVVLFISGCAKNNMWPQRIGVTAAASQEDAYMQLPPRKITVMLPLKGNGGLVATSQAIRNGLLAAYYSSPHQREIDINVIDTAGGDVYMLYQQAVVDGAEVVVGPLIKHEVETLVNRGTLPVPTIALNTLDNYYRYGATNNLYQFGLLPQDEAVQVATEMSQKELKKVAIIAPEGMWGDKIVSAFENGYGLYGGEVVATLRYRFGRDLAGQLCKFLAKDETKLCVPQKRKSKKQKNEEKPESMRRQDIDAIFLVVTTPVQARQIVPLLKFYYAGDLPLYSISTIYSGTSKPDLDQDINGVYFCDMPWVTKDIDSLNPSLQAIHEKITTTTLWKNSFDSYSKFYALGIDAYNLATGLNVLLSAPAGGVDGASGALYLDSANHIYRQLQWVQMREGAIK